MKTLKDVNANYKKKITVIIRERNTMRQFIALYSQLIDIIKDTPKN